MADRGGTNSQATMNVRQSIQDNDSAIQGLAVQNITNIQFDKPGAAGKRLDDDDEPGKASIDQQVQIQQRQFLQAYPDGGGPSMAASMHVPQRMLININELESTGGKSQLQPRTANRSDLLGDLRKDRTNHTVTKNITLPLVQEAAEAI